VAAQALAMVRRIVEAQGVVVEKTHLTLEAQEQQIKGMLEAMLGHHRQARLVEAAQVLLEEMQLLLMKYRDRVGMDYLLL
jgi:hypothetical protein